MKNKNNKIHSFNLLQKELETIEKFDLPSKDIGYLVSRKVGARGFLLWWYLWQRCVEDKTPAIFIKKESIVNDLIGACDLSDEEERAKWITTKKLTVKNWVRLLEGEKILKRIARYSEKGVQLPNLYLLNTIYPEIPKFWNDISYIMEAEQDKQKPLNKGFVYIIREDYTGRYKIGKTKKLDARLKLFNVDLPFEVELVHSIHTQNCDETERLLHEHFAHKRVNGEWFDLTEEDIAWIKLGNYTEKINKSIRIIDIG